MGFVNDYLTDEEQEMFEKRAIPNGATWKGGILGCNLPNKAICTIDRENHVYLFDLGTYHDALDFDLYNFELVWDDVLGNIGVTFTMKYEDIGEYIFPHFHLSLKVEFYFIFRDWSSRHPSCSICVHRLFYFIYN